MLRVLASLSVCLWLAAPSLSAGDALVVLDGRYRPDRAFDHFSRFWGEKDGLPNQLGAIDAPQDVPESAELGGSIHVYVRNTSPQPVTIEDVTLSGVSLKEALVYSDQRLRKKFASISFSKLEKPELDRLLACGEPVWWRADPAPIPAGGTAEVIVRLRRHPQVSAVPVGLIAGGPALKAEVRPRLGQARFRSISFDAGLKTAYLFIETNKLGAPRTILLDGKDVTAQSRIQHDANLDLTPVTVNLPSALTDCSFHVVQARLADGSLVSAGARAWAEEFVYGMFGGRPGKDGDTALARAYIDDITSHNINVQMPQMGSAAVQTFLKTDEGRAYCRERGLRMIVMNPGTWGVRDPLIYYVHDEPDCGDYKMEGVPENRKIGGMGQWCIEHARELRAADPDVPQMINVDSTYKPQNWYTYGQLADVFATDPYFQARLADAYSRRPDRIPLYTKATYLYAVASVAESACAPRPLHVFLDATARTEKTNRPFRIATPEEKRIELYYALAAGTKGLSYWWYTPGGKASGVGSADRDPAAAALWREIGRLGAEVRTAGPLLLRSCPIELPVTSSAKSLWVRCLASDDVIVLLLVNDDYETGEKGTTCRPLDNVSCRVKLPAWLSPGPTFEITSNGIRNVRTSGSGGEVTLELGRVAITRLVVIARDAALRSQLEQLYRTRFATNAVALEDRR